MSYGFIFGDLIAYICLPNLSSIFIYVPTHDFRNIDLLRLPVARMFLPILSWHTIPLYIDSSIVAISVARLRTPFTSPGNRWRSFEMSSPLLMSDNQAQGSASSAALFPPVHVSATEVVLQHQIVCVLYHVVPRANMRSGKIN